jgi:hypothetical protein
MRFPKFLVKPFGFWRRDVDPVAKAAEIKAKHQAKQQVQGLFTPAQEELMDELGLKPGSKNSAESKKSEQRVKNTKARDPLTARQRKLAEELGLIKRK